MNAPDLSPLKPVYWSDRDVVLYRGPINIAYATGSICLDGIVHLRWLPSPRIEWMGASDDPAVIAAVHQSLPGEVPVFPTASLPPNPRGVPIPIRRGRAVRVPRGKVIDSGRCDGLDWRTEDLLDRVVFHVINGPRVLLPNWLQSRQVGWLGSWSFTGQSWTIRLDSRRDGREVAKRLRTTGGFAFTHVGQLTRRDGLQFTASDAEEELERLFYYLSFIRSGLVGIALPVGYSKSRATWVKWDSGLAGPGDSLLSWCDPHATGDLSKLYPKFSKALENVKWNEAARRAVRYYVEAASNSVAEVSLIIAIAGLEMLGTAVFVARDATKTHEEWNRKKTVQRVRFLVSKIGVDLRVPQHLLALATASKVHVWADGPASITELRHTVTHWSRRKPNVESQAWVEASQLALHYLELAILWAVNYDGVYIDRLAERKYVGGGVPVPWIAAPPFTGPST